MTVVLKQNPVLYSSAFFLLLFPLFFLFPFCDPRSGNAYSSTVASMSHEQKNARISGTLGHEQGKSRHRDKLSSSRPSPTFLPRLVWAERHEYAKMVLLHSNANEQEMPRTPMLLRLAKKATLSLSGTLLEAGFEVASVTGVWYGQLCD